MSGFFPVDRGVFQSSVWLTGSPEERVLWFWLLGSKGDDGVVRHRELAIADGAKLPRAAVEAALLKFSEPDPDSRTRDHEGRRIDRTPDGFVRILNHELYYSRDYSTPRWRRWKERQRANALANAQTPLATKDKDKDKDKDTNGLRNAAPAAPPPSRPPRSSRRPSDGHGNGAVKGNGEPSWSADACTLWNERFGGVAPGGRIGKALAPLVKVHSWPTVREAWRSYLAQAEAEYASPQRFASTFGRWSGAAPEAPRAQAGKVGVGDATMAAVARYVARGGGA